MSYEGAFTKVGVEQFDIEADGIQNVWEFTYERLRDDTALIMVNQQFGNFGEPAEVEQEVLMERENTDFDSCRITFQNPPPAGFKFLIEVIGRVTKFKNNERIVSASWSAPKRQILAVQPDPTNPAGVYLTDGTYHAFEPFVSWDGKQIVFTGNEDNPTVDTEQNLYLGNVFLYSGVSGLTKITTSNRDLDFRYCPRMTRDNSIVVYLDGNGVRNRFQVKAYRVSDQTTHVLLDTTDKEISYINLSQDATLLFATVESTGSTPGALDRSILYIYDFDRQALTLTNPRTYDEAGAWLHAARPNRAGDKLVVARGSAFSFTNLSVWSYDLDPTTPPYLSNPQQLKTPVGDTPTYSSDNSKVAFISSDDGSPTGGGKDIWIMDADGTGQQIIQTTTPVDEDPIWRAWIRP